MRLLRSTMRRSIARTELVNLGSRNPATTNHRHHNSFIRISVEIYVNAIRRAIDIHCVEPPSITDATGGQLIIPSTRHEES